MKNLQKKVLAGSMVLLMAAAAVIPSGNQVKAAEKIVVGSKGFTESFLLGELYADALEDAGFEVERTFGIATPHEPIVNGDMDIYPEYVTTCLTNFLEKSASEDPQADYEIVKQEYAEKFGIAVLDLCNVDDKGCIVMLRSRAEELGVTNLTELQKVASELVLADFYGWSEREDNLIKMNKLYGDFNFKEIAGIDAGIKYDALDAGEVDVIPGNTTEPQLKDEKYIKLEEDIPVWPSYYVIPLVRQEVLDANPEIADIINKVSAALDTETMIELISQVDIEGEEYEDVAEEFFEEHIKEAE